jgi:DNA-binding transcriptional ArsR family regulator
MLRPYPRHISTNIEISSRYDLVVFADADLAAVGRMLADEHRAQFLLALLGGEELRAGELAARSGASSSLASAHLSKLLDSGLIRVRRQGRHRYYGLASGAVAEALEGLLAIAPAKPVRSLRASRRGAAIREARTCYDHLAGRLGVSFTDALEQQGALEPIDGGWRLTSDGEVRVRALGVDLDDLRRLRRPLVRQCLDWTERRPHLAGALGAALARRMFELDWITRVPETRALAVTPAGARRLRTDFALEL